MACSKAPRPALAIAGALLLCGCREAAELHVTQDTESVTFTLNGRDAPACIDSISVYPSVPDSAAALWGASRDRASPECVTRLRYGELPNGFGARTAALPLHPGASYRVMASGAGFSAAAQFARSLPEG